MPKQILPWDCGMTAEQFRAWQIKENLSGREIAELFSVWPETVSRWRKRGTPLLVKYACMAVTLGYKQPRKS